MTADEPADSLFMLHRGTAEIDRIFKTVGILDILFKGRNKKEKPAPCIICLKSDLKKMCFPLVNKDSFFNDFYIVVIISLRY